MISNDQLQDMTSDELMQLIEQARAVVIGRHAAFERKERYKQLTLVTTEWRRHSSEEAAANDKDR